MTTKHPRGTIEVRPVNLPKDDERAALPPAERPHYITRVGANGETEWTSEEYATRAGAREAARRAQRRYWCDIVEMDARGQVRKVLPGVVKR